MQINFKDLKGLRESNPHKKIVFCSGSFDLVHAGHVLFLEDCKNLGNLLVVGVAGDAILKKNKGDKRPILNQYIRLKSIDSIKSVDYSFIDDFSYKTENLLDLIEMVFKTLRPDIYVINSDTFNIPYRNELCTKYGVKLVVLERHCPKEFENLSTTKIIEKIKALQ